MDSNSQSNSPDRTPVETTPDRHTGFSLENLSPENFSWERLRLPEMHLPDAKLPIPKEISEPIAGQLSLMLMLGERVGAGMNGMVEDTVYRVGQSAIDTTSEMFEWASQLAETMLRQSHKMLDQTLQGTGQAVDQVTKLPWLRQWSNFLKLDWLLNSLDRVDVQKATDAVRKLEQQYPRESPSQIAHRVMVEKAVYSGGMGLASSLVPGSAAALLAVDLAATTALQAEMIYQIAAAYGLDLRDPARKGEALAIFGLALGGSQAMRIGLRLMRNVPMAGAIIGASTNATMMYALGYAACRFYEAKLDTQTLPTETLNTLKQASDRYLTDIAINQQRVMDQILVHMIVASYPNQDWESILPKLAALQLSPASLAAISAQIQSPQPLEQLLSQLNRDYAMPLLAQCYRIAQVNGTQSPQETQILNTIAERFDLNLDDVKRMVEGI